MVSTNLIYNGDLSHGTDSWNTTGGGTVSISDGALAVSKGDLYQDIKYLFPVANGRRYKLTFDLIVHSKATQPFYIALRCYDNTKQHINVAHTNKSIATAQTTLASALKNGDTTVTLTSGANWPTNRTYQRIGICNKLAWDYNRCTYSQGYASISDNVITLKAVWAGGSWDAGTKVAEFEDGSIYFYPYIIPNASLPTTWTTYSCEFNGGNAMRYSTQYVQFGTLGYNHNYSMRNIKLECISDWQFREEQDDFNTNISKQGIITAGFLKEVNQKIRYIRDTITGSTANSNNHWCEFQVFNDVGENIALGKDIKFNSTVYSNSIVTDGIISSSWLPSGVGGTVTLLFDIGYIEDVSKIKIWHYYPDGRTYHNNITEVSIDGENWYTVYSGEKPETADGNEIILNPDKVSIYKNGIVTAHEFYEI